MIKTEKYVIDDISTVLILELENDVAYIWFGRYIDIMNITNLDSDLAAFIHLKYDTLMWNIYKQSAQGLSNMCGRIRRAYQSKLVEM